VLGALVAAHQPRGNLVTDAQMAALAIEHWAERVRGGHRLRAVHRNPMGEPDRLTARSVRVFDFARKAS